MFETALAAAVVSHEAAALGRAGTAGAGFVAVAVGFVIVSSVRIPVAATEAGPGQVVPVRASTPSRPPAVVAHNHTQATPAMAVPLPEVGTPVIGDRLVVTLSADPLHPGLTDLTITVTDQTGAPVTEARVAVFSEMAGMAQDSQGIAAVEEEAGHYRAEDIPLSMSGPWQLSVRISPKGQPTSIVRFAVEVP